MRWQSQRVESDQPAALPGLTTMAGLVRTVRRPEFAGITFYEVHAKSVLNRIPAGSPMPFSWTVNPYRGCTHACVYCFARGTHAYLDFDTGDDFDRQIVVKTNIETVLRRELAAPRWSGEHVAMGTNTDPYQRAEGRYRLMPGVIDALTQSGTPFSILTKGTVLARDLPQLERSSASVNVGIGISLALLDDELHSVLEPGTPSPKARLELIRRIAGVGLPCGVFVAPILPYLTDGEDQLSELIGQLVLAGATGVSSVVLHLRPGTRDWFFGWLARNHPELVSRYQSLYSRGANASKDYREMVGQRFRRLRVEHGMSAGYPGSNRGVPGDSKASFPEGSLPPDTLQTAVAEQQSLF